MATAGCNVFAATAAMAMLLLEQHLHSSPWDKQKSSALLPAGACLPQAHVLDCRPETVGPCRSLAAARR